MEKSSHTLALAALCIAFVILHGALAWTNRLRLPDVPVLSAPPTAMAREGLSLGDSQFLYRAMGLQLQNAGDGGGRVTPISDYNYDHVVGWLSAMASLDPVAHYHMIMPTRYFSYTRDDADFRKLVDFIVAEASKDPARKWYWLTQAMEMTDHRLGDLDYTLEISRQLAAYDFADMPNWIFLFPAVVLEKMGRLDEAQGVLDRALAEKPNRFSQEEVNWVRWVSLRLKGEGS